MGCSTPRSNGYYVTSPTRRQRGRLSAGQQGKEDEIVGTAPGFIGIMFAIEKRTGRRHLWPIHNLPQLPLVSDWIECQAMIQEGEGDDVTTRPVLLMARVKHRELIDQANGWRCVLVVEGRYA